MRRIAKARGWRPLYARARQRTINIAKKGQAMEKFSYRYLPGAVAAWLSFATSHFTSSTS